MIFRFEDIKLDPNAKIETYRLYAVIDSIENDGYNKDYPIIIDQHGWILDGHHRYTAIKELDIINEANFVMITWEDFGATEEILKDKYNTRDTTEIDENLWFSEHLKNSESIDIEM